MTKLKYPKVIVFISIFILTIILHKTSGYRSVNNLYPTEPLSWEEIYDNIPMYLIASLIFTIVMSILYTELEKEKKRKEEEKNKRKEEELKNKKTKKEQKETEEK